MEKRDVINKILSGGMTMEEIRAAAAQRRAEAAAKAQQQLEANNEPAAEPGAATPAATEPTPQPEPVAAVASTPPQAPKAPEALSTTVEFTNQELLEFLKGRATSLITAADLSQRFKITPELANEIIEDLKYDGAEQCIKEDNTVVSVEKIEAIEAGLRYEKILGNKFIHIPSATPTTAPDLGINTSDIAGEGSTTTTSSPTPTTVADVDINLDEPAPAGPISPPAVDIDITGLEANPITPAADPSTAPRAEPAPIARASTMTERLLGGNRKFIAIGALVLGAAAFYTAVKSNKSPDQAPASEQVKQAPAAAPKPATEKESRPQQQAGQEKSVSVTKEQLLAVKLPERITESVIQILAQPNAKDFITPFLKQAKKLQTDQLVQLPEATQTKIFGILNEAENAHILNTAWSGKTGLTMSECLIDVDNTTCDLRENFSTIAKIYREILQETSGFSRLHDAQLPEKTITEMHGYVREQIQEYLAKQAATK